MRSVPLTYAELAAGIDSGAFPSERTWIDFKKRLYPGDPADKEGRARASLELAKDMASMAVLGGYLVYGVAEDKSRHVFTVDVMSLPTGLHETVDAVALGITPPLSITPHVVPDPDDRSRGFLVIEIPASPDAPHMVEGVYWGRSETGKVRLTDTDVERLILARNRRGAYLLDAMQATARADPKPSSHACHFYFTAVPATGWVDMFVGYTRDRRSRSMLSQLCTKLHNAIVNGEGGQQRPAVAFGSMLNDWRSQKVAAGWIGTWAGAPKHDMAAGR